MTLDYLHRSVLTDRVLEFLDIKPQGIYLDATLGDAGHALEIVKKGGRLIGLDQDQEALERSFQRLKPLCPDIKLILEPQPLTSLTSSCLLLKANFAQTDELIKLPLDGALFDLGVSTLQILKPSRGFTFQEEGPLDMRMDQSFGATAADLVNALSASELTRLFSELGGETHAKSIAHVIVKARASQPITTTTQLADLIARKQPRFGKLHPATKVFQALRMAVNLERDSLRQALPAVTNLLKPAARLVVISFHSGEDAIVKDFLKASAQLQVLTPKPVTPDVTEINVNPRARSAKLRAATKL